ncbi:MAG: LamG domain-containing protein, partial [Candidatus Micrarchaeota archaeon]|nr:LamG domain-containing protein [Candidatus Micrarchaeota archaeon]
GWAILAIAIVMVSLYSLGIFSLGNLKPTATPGSCQVIRTAAQVSLAGQCNNLIPRYVGQFNGHSSSIYIPSSTSLGYSNDKVTYVMWFEATANALTIQGNQYPMSQIVSCTPCIAFYFAGNGELRYSIETTTGDFVSFYSSQLLPNVWYQAVMTYDGTTLTGYLNGKLQGTATTSSGTIVNTNPLYFGSYVGIINNGNFNGSIADAQIYNASLDNTTITMLYHEGIGGAPVGLQNLVGWWPLNGNANDYSGGNNQGTPTNVIWNANWQSGYTAPSS